MSTDQPIQLLVLEDTFYIVEAIKDLLADHNRGGIKIEATFVESVPDLRHAVNKRDPSNPFTAAWLDHRVLGKQTGADAYLFLRQTYGNDILLLRISTFSDEPGYPADSIFLRKVDAPYKEAIARMYGDWRSPVVSQS